MRVRSLRHAPNSRNPFVLCCGSLKRTKSLSPCSLSVLSRGLLKRERQHERQQNDAPLRAALLFSSSLFLCFMCSWWIYKNTTLINGEILFSSIHFQHVLRTCTNTEESKSKELTLRSTETALFVLRRVSPEYPFTDLNPKWLSFHRLSLVEIFALHYKAHKIHTHCYYYHHGGRRRNRNVRVPSGNQPTVEFDHQRK